MCKISVIMSTYNTKEEYLKQSIDSILNQTFSDFEFLIVIDGECDDERVIREYNDKRIKIIKNKENMGLPGALNKAIERSHGEFIARMDSDDIASRDRFETQVKYFEDNPDIDICSMYTKMFGSQNKKLVTPLTKAIYVKCQLFFCTTITHPSVMIRRRFLIDNNLRYDEHYRYSQDFDFWSRCSDYGNIEVITKFGLNYRVHANQVSTAKKDMQFQYFKEILTTNLKKIYEDDNLDEKLNMMLLLNGCIELTNSNYLALSKFIDEVVELNLVKKVFPVKEFKKVLYYRYFSLVINRKILFNNISGFLFHKELRKKVFNIFNFRTAIKSKLISI